jgi:HK97 family phage prohead protease
MAKTMEGYMLYKDVSDGVIKDVDTVKGIITGYFSIFGNKDSDGDVVMPGAYKRTLKANGPESEKARILHLYMHDSMKPLAKPSVLKEDKTGLYFESTISHTTLGKDVIQLYQDKVLTEHSIGYQIVKREVDEQREEQKLIELKLWEGSTVSWGANMDAIVSTVKGEGMPDKKTWDKLLSMMDALDEALKGNYSDDTARQLEIQFKQLQQVIMSLARKTESVKTTPELDNPKIDVTAEWIIKKLNINL